ncbi:hypothetical protein [Shewanella atlantica]|uniref:Uncharacterized protein n=1 Tax=Shewanella atlantica TaxID=271099 RepID=A0A431W037_9GAMM|nr:hypothetical protein [Shewanella atlantica]RTR28897.1 hypothetical protein EKG39_18130 [Shewanella atlantica]
MSKQLAHLVLIISLVGQFLLTPAMAMPSLLHAFSHTQMSLISGSEHSDSELSNSELMSAETIPVVADQTLPNDNLHSSTNIDTAPEQTMTHGQKDCDMAMSGLSNHDGPTIDCDALCEMMGPGDCVSHCASATGILTQPQIDLISQVSSDRVQSGSWSTQTVELSSSNPPPKFEQA